MRKLIAVLTILGFIFAGVVPLSAGDNDRDKAKERAEDAKKKADREKKKNEIKDNEGDRDKEELKDDAEDRRDDRNDDSNVGAIVGGVAVGALLGTAVAKKAGAKKAAAAKAGQTAAAPNTMDANKDGKLSRDEFASAMTAKFKAADKDGNGSLTREEAVAAYGDQGAASFDALDKGKTGSIDMPAFNANVEQTFTWADADKDGFVTEAEKAAAAAKQ